MFSTWKAIFRSKAGRNLCYYNSKFLPVSLFFCILCSISVLLRIVRFFFLWLFIECEIILAVLLHLIHGIIRTHDQLFQIIRILRITCNTNAAANLPLRTAEHHILCEYLSALVRCLLHQHILAAARIRINSSPAKRYDVSIWDCISFRRFATCCSASSPAVCP